MRVLLLRHGHAGSKSHWRSDDRDRPLTVRGQRDAEALAKELGSVPPARLVSSPFLRCLQTLAPLAEGSGLEIEVSEDLAPDRPEAALELLRKLLADEAPGSALTCTHGEVISAVLSVLAVEDGLDVGRRPPNGKGSLWVLEGDGDRVASARYVVPGAPRARDRGATRSATRTPTRSATRSNSRAGARSGARSATRARRSRTPS